MTSNTTFEQTEIGVFMDEVYGKTLSTTCLPSKIIQILEAINETTENLRNEVRYSASRTETNIEGIVTFETTWLDPAVGVFTVQLDGVFRAYVGLQMSWEKDKHHTLTINVNDEVKSNLLSYEGEADAIFQCQ